MDTDIENEIQHREAFVIFVTGKGYIQNKRREFTDNFVHARLYGRSSQAKNSILALPKAQADSAHVIPVKIELDPRKLFAAVLKG